MKNVSRPFVFKLCLLFLCLFHVSTTSSQPTQKHTTRTQTPSGAAIATAHPYATDAGVEILRSGGNAFDAAVAITAALAVVEPYGSGLGGGGFWLLHRAEDGRQTMVDGREVAPSSASKNMYLDRHGDVIKGASFLNGNVVFLDEAGEPTRDDQYNIITMEAKLKEKLKSIIDEGRKQTGVDIKEPVTKTEDGKTIVNVSVPDTVKTMAGLIDHLMNVGLKRGTDDYFAALGYWQEKLNIK